MRSPKSVPRAVSGIQIPLTALGLPRGFGSLGAGTPVTHQPPRSGSLGPARGPKVHVQVTAPQWEPGGLIALFPRLAYWRARHLLSNIRLTKTHFAGRFPWILLQNKVVISGFSEVVPMWGNSPLVCQGEPRGEAPRIRGTDYRSFGRFWGRGASAPSKITEPPIDSVLV